MSHITSFNSLVGYGSDSESESSIQQSSLEYSEEEKLQSSSENFSSFTVLESKPFSPTVDLTGPQVSIPQPVISSVDPAEPEEDINLTELFALDYESVTLPPPPTAPCSKELQRKVEKILTSGENLNKALKTRQRYQNPYICEVMVKKWHLEEFGSNYPKEVFDPSEFGPEASYDEIAKRIALQNQNSKKICETISVMAPPSKSPTSFTAVKPVTSSRSTTRKTKWGPQTN